MKRMSSLKLKASIVVLVQNAENLDTFVGQPSIMRTLGRLLADELKGNVDVLINILQIFFCFSSFSQLHRLLLTNKVGETTMKILDLERKRYDHRMGRWKDAKAAGRFGEEETRKAVKVLEKQEHLLYISYYILLNLAEDSQIQVKMIQRDIVESLLDELRRQSTRELVPGTHVNMTDDLLQLAVIFLKSISIFEENIQELSRLGAMRKLQALYEASTHPDLRDEVLQLMFNLSFDDKQRALVISNGFHKHIVEAIGEPVTRHVAIKLLYHVTCGLKMGDPSALTEDLVVSLQNATKIVSQLIIACRKKLVDDHLISLGVNLAAHECCATVIAQGEFLPRLLKRSHTNLDNLLMKMVRNVSNHPRLWKAFTPFMHQLVGMALRSESHDYLVEALRTLGNIQVPDVLYHQLLIKHGFLEPLTKYLNAGMAEDDIVLAVLIVIGTFAIDPRTGPLFGNRKLVDKMFLVLKDKKQDEDMVLQGMFALFRISLYKHGREAVSKHEDMVNLLLEFTTDESEEIRNLTNKVLDLVVQSDSDGWQSKIRERRFYGMNREWIEYIDSTEAEQEDFKDGDMYDDAEGQYYDDDEYHQMHAAHEMWGDNTPEREDGMSPEDDELVEPRDYGESLESSGRFSPRYRSGAPYDEEDLDDDGLGQSRRR